MRYDLGRFRRPMRRSTETQLLSLIGLGDGSTLSLDFTAMSSLDSRFTFTRASTGTYIDSSGLVTTMAAASTNDPTKARFDYDPTTLAPRGLLIEGTSTNLLCWSESFATSGGSTNWGYNSNTGAVVSTSNPAGGSTAFQFAETANSGPLQQSVTVTNAVHTFSAWFKGSTYSGTTTTQVQFGLFVSAFIAGTAAKISGPGSVSVAGNIVTLSGLSTSEWTRVQFTTTSALSAGSVAILIYPNSTSLQTNASFYIWGAQLEAGVSASSYIPTGPSTVQRAVDQMTMADIAALSFNQAGGTVFMQIEGNPKDVNTFPHFAAFEQSPLGRGWSFSRFNNSTTAGPRVIGTAYTAAGSTIISSSGHTRPSGKFKFATTLEPSVCRMTYVIAGGSALVDTATAGTLATIGSLKFNNTIDATASDFGSVWISQFKYWPTVLLNATLQSLTA